MCLLALQISEPATLLLDEPFASLDLLSQARLAAQLEASDHQILVSTHLLEHVYDFERVLWLEQGKVRADGPGREGARPMPRTCASAPRQSGVAMRSLYSEQPTWMRAMAAWVKLAVLSVCGTLLVWSSGRCIWPLPVRWCCLSSSRSGYLSNT